MPKVTDDEVGRRLFKLNQERYVEESVEKMRRHLGKAWKMFPAGDVEVLKYILGEAWIAMERKEWMACSFAKVTEKDVAKIIEIGKSVKEQKITESSGVETVSLILKRYT